MEHTTERRTPCSLTAASANQSARKSLTRTRRLAPKQKHRRDQPPTLLFANDRTRHYSVRWPACRLPRHHALPERASAARSPTPARRAAAGRRRWWPRPEQQPTASLGFQSRATPPRASCHARSAVLGSRLQQWTGTWHRRTCQPSRWSRTPSYRSDQAARGRQLCARSRPRHAPRSSALLAGHCALQRQSTVLSRGSPAPSALRPHDLQFTRALPTEGGASALLPS